MALLKTLEVGYKWSYENDDGSVVFPHNIRKRDKGLVLSMNMRLALAINQVCCELGFGKVLAVFNDGPHLIRYFESPEEYELYHTVRSVPGLLYSPEFWSTEMQDSWRGASPAEQVERSWAPHGWLHQEAIVLPFSHVLSTPKWIISRPYLPYHDPAPVVLLAGVDVKGVFVGETREMRVVCHEHKELQGTKIIRHEYLCDGPDYSAFHKWKEEGLSGVVRALDRIARESDQVIQYGALMSTYRQVSGVVSTLQARADQSSPRDPDEEAAIKTKKKDAENKSGQLRAAMMGKKSSRQ